ncbi:4'-phosphopantetheinyl transferase superfamily protein [Marinobacter salinisoli]|uniref:4'-phosphopantetheinyl transferase superfamily protein n=1 Tax=Marinobacter salinisoli TaxID=2769486 RepID=A0ABX7MX61_9GAMM|nr:4'-phosphopantetheinyl transferase superfamily protein [Marinobacter salinisoli]QSP95696.1 4'-phosphopantetheinyl transferase superfamily protein [Marinobacter salinisoli]
MAGSSSACNPDSAPILWLCRGGEPSVPAPPNWLTGHEHTTLSGLTGPRRHEFLLSRWLIRQALSAASQLPVEACRPVDGRPVRSAAPEGWRLSLSHSQGTAACAISHGFPIGVDIEPLQRRPQWQAIVKRWFSPREQSWLLAENDVFSFLKVWTLKEAWLKATGRGIAGNLQTLEVLPEFELVGDQDEPGWHASIVELPDCLATLVWHQATAGEPDVVIADPPGPEFRLDSCQRQPDGATPILRQTIQPRES